MGKEGNCKKLEAGRPVGKLLQQTMQTRDKEDLSYGSGVGIQSETGEGLKRKLIGFCACWDVRDDEGEDSWVTTRFLPCVNGWK